MMRNSSAYRIAGVVLFLASLLFLAAHMDRPTSQAAGAPIRLRVATFYPAQGETPALPAALMLTEEDLAGPAYYLVQCKGPIQEEWKKELAAIGAQLAGYIPDYAFKARMTPEAVARATKLPFVAWVGPFHPAYKLSPELKRQGEHLYRMVLEQGADPERIRAEIEGLGGEVLSLRETQAIIRLDASLLGKAARIADVAWIENHDMMRLHNDQAAAELHAPPAWSSGWTGAGQMICIADTGLDTGADDPGRSGDIHADFDNRVAHISSWPIQPSWSSYVDNPGADDGPSDVDSGHGTHVVGSAAGNGARSGGAFRGIAYQASIAFQAVEQYVDFKSWVGRPDGYYLLGIPDDLKDLFNEAYGWGARVHSNSWGGGDPGAYDNQSRQADQFIWNHKDMTIFFSAGNDGKDANRNGIVDEGSVTSPGTAKNVITVGGCENRKPVPSPNPNSGTYGGWWPLDFPVNPLRDDPMANAGADGMVAFSSRGPTDDGRIKPDVVAPGTWILSARSSRASGDGWGSPYNAYYMYMGGTSMSTPLVAGAAAVLRQFYAQAKGHANPSAALIKATLINTATAMPGQYPAPYNDAGFIPNNHQGWGVVNLQAATDSAAIRFEDQNSPLSTGQSRTFTYSLASAARPLKVTVVWSDYPGTAGAGRELVNDLDLVVITPDGTSYRGNNFSNGWSLPGGSADRVNNVECVYIQSPPVGTYQIRVEGANVPQGPQPFALVVTAEWAQIATATPTPTRTATPTLTLTPTSTRPATSTPTPTPTSEIITQRIPLHSGWNWFSFYVLPADPTDISTVLASISGKYDLILGEDGAYAPPPADPRFNSLTRLDAGKTYLIRMTQAAEEPNPLMIQGRRASVDAPIRLEPGWRWPGYLPDRSLPVETALASIAGRYDLVLSENKAYAPPPADPRFNSLTEMVAGGGYMIRMTSPGSLVYPADSAPSPTPTSTPTVSVSNWVTIVREDFEGDFPGSWQLLARDSGAGEYYWGKRDCRVLAGNYSGWAVGGGMDGSGLPCGARYGNNRYSWMIYGPFSLADAKAAFLTHKMWVNTTLLSDALYTVASLDGQSFYGTFYRGETRGWIGQTLDLSQAGALGNLLGQPNVWVALVFASDALFDGPEGAYVDDILLRKCVSGDCELSPSLVTLGEPAFIRLEP